MPSTPPSSDSPNIPHTTAQLRAHVQACKQTDPAAWALTRKLVHPSQLAGTVAQLTERIQRSALPDTVRAQLVAGLERFHAPSNDMAGNAMLKECTGLPHTKAIRALCLYFALLPLRHSCARRDRAASMPVAADREAFAQQGLSPYELLLRVENPSLLDLGAGDLSFEEELLDRYLPALQQRKKMLTLHALDRLQPGSQLGGRYHASPERLRRFARIPSDHLQFRFRGGVDMMDPALSPALLARYTIVTCHAPATPTFAYEPTRLSPSVIRSHLARTKGNSRIVRVNGEEALNVMHRGRNLTFPPWKFLIQGPLALLNLAASRGELCVLSAIDDEVFWEFLAQLVDDPAMRPADVVFTPDTLPGIFGPVHRELTSLKIGECCRLSDVSTLRRAFPHGPQLRDRKPFTCRFRFVEIRRGAVFPDMPAGMTARQFRHMSEEAPPWQLVLVPERLTKEQ